MRTERAYVTGLKALDALAPGGGFRCGAVHELLFAAPAPAAMTVALRLAIAGQQKGKFVVWSDPASTFYPPAAAGAGIDLARLILLRRLALADELWALHQCLGCAGVGATVACIHALSRVQARRLQLAAERGGGIGIFLRPFSPGQTYAAATRWLAAPRCEDADGRQQWTVRLIHGHGGQIDRPLCLEVDRESHAMRAFEPVADRPPAAAARRITA